MNLTITALRVLGQLALAAGAILALMVSLVEMPEPVTPPAHAPAPKTPKPAAVESTAGPNASQCIFYHGM